MKIQNIIIYKMSLTINQYSQNGLPTVQNPTWRVNDICTMNVAQKQNQQQYSNQQIQNNTNHPRNSPYLQQNPQQSDTNMKIMPNTGVLQTNYQSQSSQSMLLDSQTSIADLTPVHNAQPDITSKTKTFSQIPHVQQQFSTVNKKLFDKESQQFQASISLTQINSSCPQRKESLKYSNSNKSNSEQKYNNSCRWIMADTSTFNQIINQQQTNTQNREKQTIPIQHTNIADKQTEYKTQSPPIMVRQDSNKEQKQSPYLSYKKITSFDLVCPDISSQQNLLSDIQNGQFHPYPINQNQNLPGIRYKRQQGTIQDYINSPLFSCKYSSPNIIYEEYLQNSQQQQQPSSLINLLTIPIAQTNDIISQMKQQPLITGILSDEKQSKILPSLHVDNHKWNYQNHPDNDHTLLGCQAIKDLFKQFQTNQQSTINHKRSKSINKLFEKCDNQNTSSKSPFKKVKSNQKIVYEAQQKIQKTKQKPPVLNANPLNVPPARRINKCLEQKSHRMAIMLEINIIQQPIYPGDLIQDSQEKKSIYLKNVRPQQTRHVNDPDMDSRYMHEQPLADLIQSIQSHIEKTKQFTQKVQKLTQGESTNKLDIATISIQQQSQQQQQQFQQILQQPQVQPIQIQPQWSQQQLTQSTPLSQPYRFSTQQKIIRQQSRNQNRSRSITKIIKISRQRNTQPQSTPTSITNYNSINNKQDIKIIKNNQDEKVGCSTNRVRDRIKVFIRKNNKLNNNITSSCNTQANTIPPNNNNNIIYPEVQTEPIPFTQILNINKVQSIYNIRTQLSQQYIQPHQHTSGAQYLYQNQNYRKLTNIFNNTNILQTNSINPPKNTPNYSPVTNKVDENINKVNESYMGYNNINIKQSINYKVQDNPHINNNNNNNYNNIPYTNSTYLSIQQQHTYPYASNNNLHHTTLYDSITVNNSQALTLSDRNKNKYKQKIDIVSHASHRNTNHQDYYTKKNLITKHQQQTKCNMLSNNNKINPFLLCSAQQPQLTYNNTNTNINSNGKKKLLNLNGKTDTNHKFMTNNKNDGHTFINSIYKTKQYTSNTNNNSINNNSINNNNNNNNNNSRDEDMDMDMDMDSDRDKYRKTGIQKWNQNLGTYKKQLNKGKSTRKINNYSPNARWIQVTIPRSDSNSKNSSNSNNNSHSNRKQQPKTYIQKKQISNFQLFDYSQIMPHNQQHQHQHQHQHKTNQIQQNIKYLTNLTKAHANTNTNGYIGNRKNKHLIHNELNNNNMMEYSYPYCPPRS